MTTRARIFRTWSPKASEIKRDWLLVDADGQVLGRFATQIATLLRGKHKPTYTPHMDLGDNVVVINAEKIRVTGKKPQQKMYYRHSGYPGGLKAISYYNLHQKRPERIIKLAVKGMLPKNRLGRRMLKKLHIYAGPRHPHAAQQPQPYAIETTKERS
jgi:large subunit ribosomal protein L13